ncbi:type II CRISPR RNA-guided endonuclease Cas9 [Listeria seeligeri]|nr:type II CRISPR RNA-guided endonuclease Cas9 [Listeria seeligeri]MBM5676782.1 type II CRISPR RNA-guided endonuclease Cas9 [Listeria seeligeri]
MMSKLILGLDIGISSVGWGVLDESTNEVVDAGVRLFEEATRNGNEDRRGFRSARRLKRRRQHRLERARSLIENNGFSCAEINKFNPYQARYNAIFGEVTKDELAAALFHLAKRRGTTIDAPEEEVKDAENELSTKMQLEKNAKKLATKYDYICEIQLEKLKENKVVRDHENRFRTEDYVKEARAILENQQKYYPEVTNEFIESYMALIETRRMYYDGPGSEKSPTPYGQYFIDENGNPQRVTMIDKMRGKCTYFPEEPRIAKMSYTAELYGLLNDFNNIYFADPETGEKIGFTEADKKYFIDTFIHDPKGVKNITLKQIMKYKNIINETDIFGYRINTKNGTPIFTEFKGLKALKKALKEVDLPDGFYQNIEVMDEIANILSSEKSFTRREEQLKELFLAAFNDELEEAVKELINDTSFKEFHSLSKKAIMVILPELWSTNQNQMQLFVQHKMDKSRLENLQNGTKIQFDDEAILSTVAKRAHRETIKIVDAVRAKYGELDYVIVEMAREKNSDEQKKVYNRAQKKQGDFEKEMCKLLGVSELKELRLNGKQHLALKFWKEQDGKCIYSGKPIALSDIVNNFNGLLEIDHIIPISISYDDSQQNKVLCLRSENQRKGQLSPYQYLIRGMGERSFDAFKAEVLSRHFGKKKQNYLLEMEDVANNDELRKRFINRNLVDTRYAMRTFSNTLKTFYTVNGIPTKVMPVNGAMTSALRKRAKLNKDRDAGHAHHAIDALIVAAIGRLPLIKQLAELRVNEEGEFADKITDKGLDDKTAFDDKTLKFLRNLLNYESKVKYSHKVDRKPNRSLSKQTLYSTREKDGEKYIIGKVKNIYTLDKKGYAALKKRIDKNPDDFLMAQHNPKTWEEIIKIMEVYSKSDNPFKEFYDEHGFIMKDGKVPVKSLRYHDKKLGIHVPLTHKYENTRHDVVLLKRNSLRVDIYMNKEGVYKYQGVPYNWFNQKGDKYILDMEKYHNEIDGTKASFKNIDNTFEFQFSLYKNDVFSYMKKDKEGEFVSYTKLFRSDSSPRGNQLEVENIDMRTSSQQMPTINPLKNLIKYNTDILGNTYPIQKEKFVTVFTLHSK